VSRSREEPDSLVLLPNQRALFRAKEQLLRKELAEKPVLLNPGMLTVNFSFDDEQVGKVFSMLEKAYGIPLKFNEEKLKDCYVTLPFREESFYRMLDVICRTIKATYEVTDDHVEIKSTGCVNRYDKTLN